MSKAHWLLEARIDGRIHRWSDVAVEVDDADGNTWPYRTGLADISQSIGEDASVEVVDPEVNWPALVDELEGQPCVLRRWLEGTVLEQSVVYSEGEARGVSHGARQEPVSWAVVQVGGALNLGVQIPDALARVDETTWPASGSIGDAGAPYPVIFGFPGWGEGAGGLPTAVVPCPLAQWSVTDALTYAVVSEDDESEIDRVFMANETLNLQGSQDVSSVSDLLGRRVRVATFALSPTLKPTDDTEQREIYIGYAPTSGWGGGVARTAYEVFEYVMRRWGRDSVDWNRIPEVRDVLGAFLVDSWIDEPMEDPWSWWESVLGPDLPIEVRTSTKGRFLVAKRYRTDPIRFVGTIDVDNGDAFRISNLDRSGDEPMNEFVGRFRANTRGDWLGRIILTGDPTRIESAPTVTAPTAVSGGTQTVVAGNSLCALSFARYALRTGQPVDVDWTWDAGTMLRVLSLRAEQQALPAKFLSLQVRNGEDLNEGDEVQITDSEIELSSVGAIVDAPPVVSARSGAEVVFRIPATK